MLKTVEKLAMPRIRRKYDRPPDNPISDEGIEAIIGHLKNGWQMGRNRMKYDRSTESAGYCAVLGFNMRQMMRYLTGQVPPVVIT